MTSIALLLSIVFLFVVQTYAASSYSSTNISLSGTIKYDPSSSQGWLHTDGIYVKDSQNRQVAMRILANFGWSFPTAALIQNAKAAGINVLQLGINRPGENGYTFDYNTQATEMDMIINLCKQNGMYVSIVHLIGTTTLSGMGISGVTNVVNYETEFWTPIITRYKNEPTVVGVKLIDEPNLTPSEEDQLWTTLIGNMRAINPNLLWFTHTINVLRFGEYFGALPWKTPSDVPYPNIIMDGGMWISATNSPEFFDPYYGTSTETEARIRADQICSTVMSAMTTFRNTVQIPTGVTPGSDDYFNSNSARIYLLTTLESQVEAGRYIMTLYAADYLLGNGGNNCFDAVFPDRPYPLYW